MGGNNPFGMSGNVRRNRQAAWINKPKVESEKGMLAENIPIPGVSVDGSEIDRRSWGILEKDICRQAGQTLGNDTKFESEVSQNH
jgi:hypothetical protein